MFTFVSKCKEGKQIWRKPVFNENGDYLNFRECTVVFDRNFPFPMTTSFNNTTTKTLINQPVLNHIDGHQRAVLIAFC